MFNEGVDMMIASSGVADAFVKVTGAGQRFRVTDYKTKPSPKKGELFKLSEALKPSVIALEVCKAWGLCNPPVLLTYTGNETGAEVRTQFAL
jgi:hypothetical protein